MNQPRINGTTRRTQTAPTRMTHPSAAQSLRNSRVIGTADHQSTYAIKEDFRPEGNSRTPCERCLFKMIRDGGHECKPQPRGPRRRIACLFCAKQKKGCKKVSFIDMNNFYYHRCWLFLFWRSTPHSMIESSKLSDSMAKSVRKSCASSRLILNYDTSWMNWPKMFARLLASSRMRFNDSSFLFLSAKQTVSDGFFSWNKRWNMWGWSQISLISKFQ